MASKLRKPNDYESDDCVKLIFISGPDVYRYSMVEGEPEIYDILKIFHEQTGSLYSQEFSVVEEDNEKIRGLILAYPANRKKQMAKSMMKCIRGIFKLKGFLHLLKMVFRMGMNRYYPGTEDDEFFISNLAVFEPYRGNGIGFKLLMKAEEIAIENGLKKLSLNVEIDNSHAIRIYEKFGFRKVKTSIFPKKYNQYNLLGFKKMVKILGEN